MKGGRRHVGEAAAAQFTQVAPPGWGLAQLGDAAELQPGYAFDSDRFVAEGVRLLRGTNIIPGGTRWEDTVCLPPDRVEQFTAFRLEPGDIVIAMDRPFISTGLKVARLTAADCPALLLQRVGRFRPSAAMSADYLHHYVNGTTFSAHTGGLATGTQLPHISKTDIETCPVLIPPLNEQRRIVAKLDAIFEQTRAAKARLERLPALLEKLKRSILAAAFRGDLTKDWRVAHPDVEPASVLLDRIRAERRRRWEDGMRAKGKDPTKANYEEPETTSAVGNLPDQWAWASMGQAFVVQVGATPSRADPTFWGGDLPWVSSGEVAFCRISSTKEQITRAGLHNSSTRLQPVGTVLLGMIGEGKTRGQPAILDIAACTNQNSAAIRVSETEVIPEYVYFHLAFEYENTRRIGSGNNQQALNKSRVEAMILPVAPVDEQREIVRRLRETEHAMDSLHARFSTQLELVESIERAALDKAFRGELVPQDPTDEPASVLLDRIRAARSAKSELPRRGRGPRRDDSTVAEAASTVTPNGHATNGQHDEPLALVAGVFQIDRRLTMPAVAEATGLGTSAVKKALKILVDGGQLRVHGRARAATYEWTA